MKGKLCCLLLALSLLLTGCGWFDGAYVSVTPHEAQSGSAQAEVVSASSYVELRTAMEEMVSAGIETQVIHVADFDETILTQNMELVIEYICQRYPIGAYAVEEITYEVGTSTGKPAIAVSVAYRHSRSEILRIRDVQDVARAELAIEDALRGMDNMLVLEVRNYQETDFVQIVQDYALEHPEYVMEVPQVTMGIYGDGESKVVELTFSYQTSRDSLKQMETQVQPIFDAAALYVTGDAVDRQKYTQLYSFLMERFDYTVETSITPAYSLLCHGVGDSRAFAQVYASMCRRAGLECMVVSGTRSGEPWTWNIVLDSGQYYHVDLLRCSSQGAFRQMLDSDMTGYVWDYSAYPECAAPYIPPTEAAPSADPVPTEVPPETTENME